MIANSRNLARPALRPLLADVELPADYFHPDRERQARSSALLAQPGALR